MNEYEKIKETVFELMCGETDIQSLGIQNEFENGSSCEQLYQELYGHIENLCKLQNTENSLERIQECHFQLLKILCYKMFDYGWALSASSSH